MKSRGLFAFLVSLLCLGSIEAAVCPTCGGAGGKRVVLRSVWTTQSEWIQCPTCGGTGRIPDPVSVPSAPSGGNFTPRQQLMLQGAGAIGNAAGQALGNAIAESLFGNSGSSEADIQAQQQQQEEAARQERLRQAQLRLQRLQQAARLRVDWDSRDQAMSQELSGVFDVPLGPQTPFFGVAGPSGAGPADPVGDDPSVVDLRGTSAADGNGVVPIDLGSSAQPVEGSGSSVAGPDFSAPGSPITDAAGSPPPRVYTRAEIQAQIKSVQNALRQLNRSMQLDASQRKEWEQTSEEARQAGGEVAVDMGSDFAMKHMLSRNQEQVGRKVVELAGEDLPLLRFQKQEEFRILRRDKKLLKAVDTAHGISDTAADAGEAVLAKGWERLEPAGEALSDVGSMVLDGSGIGEFNTAKNATYAGLAQYDSWQRLAKLNDNAEQNLKAVKALEGRLHDLIQMEQKLGR